MDVVIRARVTARLRCAWCHDAEGAGSGSQCGACRTWLHGDCWSEARDCPTRGCPQQRRPVVAPRRLRREQASSWLFGVAGAAFVLLVLLVGAVTKFQDALGNARNGTTKLDSDITAKINAGGQ